MLNLFTMTTYYMPLKDNKPAALNINGHRLLLVAPRKNTIEENLKLMGADTVKRIRVVGSDEEQMERMMELGRSAQGGVVVAPPDEDLSTVIRSLEESLPWLH